MVCKEMFSWSYWNLERKNPRLSNLIYWFASALQRSRPLVALLRKQLSGKTGKVRNDIMGQKGNSAIEAETPGAMAKGMKIEKLG